MRSNPHRLSYFAIAVMVLGGALSPAAFAQDCGGVDNACAVEGGTYHVLRADTEDTSGVVIHLHGGGGSGRGMLNSGLAKSATARGYIFVAPNGEHPEARWSKDWSVNATGMTFERNDLAFLIDVLDDVRVRFDANDLPVLLAGFSRGGSMVWDVACEQPGFADAYAPAAGAFWDALPSSCAGPVKLFHTHGWTDRTVPLEGRSFNDGQVVQGDVWASLKVMRTANGCQNRQPSSSSFDGDVWFRHWDDCDGGQIDLLLHQGGHGVPENWPEIVIDWFEN